MGCSTAPAPAPPHPTTVKYSALGLSGLKEHGLASRSPLYPVNSLIVQGATVYKAHSHTLSHLIPIANLEIKEQVSHFTNREAEAQREKVTC